ncbi:unannotated protein [freshwater metagenome]|uniref:Unannotated protein n=1 Tax=freshwater metagenome TaxID=449393 RepID=A0A6J6Y5A6_9ZZZZ|nr:hypothetical protein [Actinomycetota bacterium]MSW62678.1 hypothetical protein [Actinomycetota bacterium]MSX89756.1 hypothetical protein [Actinomycetota bacterium]MSZ63588.1 hypothetical protein [Actinomycetota bacterium]MTA58593.1 hypothetical protein [Actinomycetota bacterium]
MLGRRKKKAPIDEAAEIIAKHHARRERDSKMFTPAQEELRRQLGLHPELRPDTKAVRKEKAKDPLTKRQRAMMKELGLTKDED